MENSNVISLCEVKKKQRNSEEEKLFNSICVDIYIPYNEIKYWKNFIEFGMNYSNNMYEKTKNSIYRQFQEVFELLSVDIDQYEDFGYTLDNFRFIFSYFEVFTFYKVMNAYKEQHEEYSKENTFYFNKMRFEINQNKELFSVLEYKLN